MVIRVCGLLLLCLVLQVGGNVLLDNKKPQHATGALSLGGGGVLNSFLHSHSVTPQQSVISTSTTATKRTTSTGTSHQHHQMTLDTNSLRRTPFPSDRVQQQRQQAQELVGSPRHLPKVISQVGQNSASANERPSTPDSNGDKSKSQPPQQPPQPPPQTATTTTTTTAAGTATTTTVTTPTATSNDNTDATQDKTKILLGRQQKIEELEEQLSSLNRDLDKKLAEAHFHPRNKTTVPSSNYDHGFEVGYQVGFRQAFNVATSDYKQIYAFPEGSGHAVKSGSNAPLYSKSTDTNTEISSASMSEDDMLAAMHSLMQTASMAGNANSEAGSDTNPVPSFETEPLQF